MQYTFSEATKHMTSSAVREILKLTQGKSIISFAGGLPAEELFPIEAVREAFQRVFDQGSHSLQYGLTAGYTPLREQICARLAKKGMNVTKDDMVLTTGSQQAIDLLTRIYIEPGDVIMVENPTYLAALQVFHSRGASVIPVPGDDSGMDMEALVQQIEQHRPKLVYVTPTFSNPTGRVWSIERRKQLLAICRDYQVLILEDDPYGELQYDSEDHYPSIFSLDRHPEDSVVVYTSTFSKTVVPALRTGWVIGDRRIIQFIERAKEAADLHSSSLDQQALYQLMSHFDLDEHIATIRQQYKQRMRLMTDLLTEHTSGKLRWNEPKGGMFLWVELPEGLHAQQLLKKAVDKGVAFVPGSTFYANSPQMNTMRLNFTHTNRENMILGMERLAAALSDLSG
jgi:2-aminoadipate transaminase